jgi:hypothetical protein
VKIEDKRAAESLIRLLEKMRETGRLQGRIEITVNEGNAMSARIVKVSESECLQG